MGRKKDLADKKKNTEIKKKKGRQSISQLLASLIRAGLGWSGLIISVGLTAWGVESIRSERASRR